MKRQADSEAFLKAAFKRAKKDFRWFCRVFVKIEYDDGSIHPFVINEAQEIILQAIERQERAGLPIRIIITKGRQQGCSTLIQVWIAWKVMLGTGLQAITIGYDLESAGLLFRKSEVLYQEFPDDCGFKPPLRSGGRTGRKLVFDKPNRGMLYVETAEKQAAGRGGTYQIIHATEVPYWVNAEGTLNGLLDVVRPKPGTAIFIESTAGGVGDTFHDLWEGAVAGTNGFEAVFVPWFLTAEYRIARNPIDAPLDYRELELQRRYSIDDEQLLWYRAKLATKKGSITALYREFPSCPDDAFTSAGMPFFIPDDLAFYRKNMVRPPLRKGEFRIVGKRAKLVDDPQGRWWLWKLPVPGHDYAVFGDPSSGRAKDASAIVVLDCDTMEVVATFSGQILPDEHARELNRIGLVYNVALVSPENNNHGELVIHNLSAVWRYPNLYVHRSEINTDASDSPEFGWRTTSRTRPLMLNILQELIHNRELKFYCSRVLRELESMHVKEPKPGQSRTSERVEALGSAHDDLVMALAGACAIRPAATGRLVFSVA